MRELEKLAGWKLFGEIVQKNFVRIGEGRQTGRQATNSRQTLAGQVLAGTYQQAGATSRLAVRY